MMTAEAIIETLGLLPHPEGGHYREMWRDAAGTAILYLLKAGERSHWHRVTHAAECWHWHAGGALRLRVSDGTAVTEQLLGMELAAGQRPLGVVPVGQWQAAEPVDGWVLVGCTVSPAFDFACFEMAPPGWEPGA